MKKISILSAIAVALILGNFQSYGQNKGKGREKRDKDYEKEYKKQGKKGKSEDYNDTRSKNTNNEMSVDIEINLPSKKNPDSHPYPPGPQPRYLTKVPRGHYPPPGKCRIWYPDTPPGHQPPPQSCQSLQGVSLTKGAFILTSEGAYDGGYNWENYEKTYPGSVPTVVLDILFPNWRVHISK